MTTQPRALALADALDRGSDYPPTLSDAAAELRRLSALNAQLLEALKDMNAVLQEAMTTGGWVPTPVQASFRDAWFDMADAIKAAEAE